MRRSRGTGGPVCLRDLYAAYIACRRGKRQARNTQAYEAKLLDQLIETRDALNARTWRPLRTLTFVVNHPKIREIHAADFSDRVVHHWLVPRLEAWFEPAGLCGEQGHAPAECCSQVPSTAITNAQLPDRVAALKQAGTPFIIVREEGYLKGDLKRRVLSEISWPSFTKQTPGSELHMCDSDPFPQVQTLPSDGVHHGS